MILRLFQNTSSLYKTTLFWHHPFKGCASLFQQLQVDVFVDAFHYYHIFIMIFNFHFHIFGANIAAFNAFFGKDLVETVA